MTKLEEVFKVSGVPTFTFVPPVRYEQLKISIRTPGRCAVIEGPSGIGKTSSVAKIIEELGLVKETTFLSARRPSDVEYIRELPSIKDIGLVIVDDFHRLDDEIKASITDFMKILADEGNAKSKILLIGINKAGDRLVQYGGDVGLRVDVFKLEGNPDPLVDKLVSLGEAALNIKIDDKAEIVRRSAGSFQIAQLLCHELCVASGVTSRPSEYYAVERTLDSVMDDVLANLRRVFHTPCVEFAQGSKLKREGRAPYLYILKWLSESQDWSVDLRRSIKDNPEHRGSVGQVVTKGHLKTLLREKANILDDVFHYQPETNIFTVEDPKLVFYLRSLNWATFTREVGYTTSHFSSEYDVALSFAGTDRDLAKALFDKLSEREVVVFYDKNEQHRIISQNIEEYLAPIYASKASYVIPLLSPEYPNRIWTKFESDNFRSRFGDNAVIPIRYRTAKDGYFSDAAAYGSLSFDPCSDLTTQVDEIVETICRRLEQDRLDGETKGSN